jgi:hypothetical protein
MPLNPKTPKPQNPIKTEKRRENSDDIQISLFCGMMF